LSTSGCPQGSTCGPIFWNILYDSVLDLQLPPNCDLIAFADDLVLICSADDIESLQTLANRTIKIIVKGGKDVKLNFNESKTYAMMFTRLRNTPTLNLSMNGKNLVLVKQIRYLGIVIDHKLSWRPHLNYIKGKVAKVQNIVSSIVRNTWGASFEVAKLLYTAVIEAITLYGLSSWGSALRHKYAQTILTQIQRNCLLRVCKAYRTSAADSLCVIAGLMPLHLKAQMRYEQCKVQTEGFLVRENVNIPIQQRILSTRHPSIEIEHFTNPTSTHTPLAIYTDGSKMEGRVGFAFVTFYEEEEICNEFYRLPDFCSVFQAELLAIRKALEYILVKELSPITLFSDSKSSIEAIRQRKPSNKIVSDIQGLFLQLQCNNQQIVIKWIKAHEGHFGNERADELAKNATQIDDILPHISAPPSFVTFELCKKFKELWNRYWQRSTKGRWTYKCFPTIGDRFKCQISINHELTQLLSNHGKHRQYLARFKITQMAHCRFCMTTVESFDHLLFDCNQFAISRFALEQNTLASNISFNVEHLPRILQNNATLKHFLSFYDKIYSKL
jgi:ribonuclease HI